MVRQHKKNQPRSEVEKINRTAAELARRSRDLLEHAAKTHRDFEKLEPTAEKLHATVRSTRAKNRRILAGSGKNTPAKSAARKKNRT